MEYLLQLQNISKSFGSVKALDSVSFNLKAGTVHALMGENGAGKSTLMKCLFGLYKKDSGAILIDGKSVEFDNPRQALNNKVAMVHQELNQVTKRTVVDNIFLGRYNTKFGFVKKRQMYLKTHGILNKLEINISPNRIVNTLSVSERQMVEIAKAVSYNSRILVFDEPTSSLATAEAEHLFKIIDMLKKNGVGIIYISHKMDEILKISDEVTVMRDGKHVATTSAKELTMDIIINQMVGRELSNRYPTRLDTVSEESILSVSNLNCEKYIKNVSFELKKGEILGVGGLVGSRRTELIETLFGLRELKSGTIVYNGQTIYGDNKNKKTLTPKKQIGRGFALITEERKATGIFGVLDISFNSAIASLKRYEKFGYIQDNRIKKDTIKMIKSMRVKTPSVKTKIGQLSGGNQQKVIIGRWLLTTPKVLLLDEPTRGIDVGAKYEIYQLINQLTEQGSSIIMVSSEMDELFGVSDRILVMSNGQLAGIVDTKTTNQEEIMRLATQYV